MLPLLRADHDDATLSHYALILCDAADAAATFDAFFAYAAITLMPYYAMRLSAFLFHCHALPHTVPCTRLADAFLYAADMPRYADVRYDVAHYDMRGENGVMLPRRYAARAPLPPAQV